MSLLASASVVGVREKRKSMYDSLTSRGWDMGSFEDFDAELDANPHRVSDLWEDMSDFYKEDTWFGTDKSTFLRELGGVGGSVATSSGAGASAGSGASSASSPVGVATSSGATSSGASEGVGGVDASPLSPMPSVAELVGNLGLGGGVSGVRQGAEYLTEWDRTSVPEVVAKRPTYTEAERAASGGFGNPKAKEAWYSKYMNSGWLRSDPKPEDFKGNGAIKPLGFENFERPDVLTGGGVYALPDGDVGAFKASLENLKYKTFKAWVDAELNPQFETEGKTYEGMYQDLYEVAQRQPEWQAKLGELRGASDVEVKAALTDYVSEKFAAEVSLIERSKDALFRYKLGDAYNAAEKLYSGIEYANNFVKVAERFGSGDVAAGFSQLEANAKAAQTKALRAYAADANNRADGDLGANAYHAGMRTALVYDAMEKAGYLGLYFAKRNMGIVGKRLRDPDLPFGSDLANFVGHAGKNLLQSFLGGSIVEAYDAAREKSYRDKLTEKINSGVGLSDAESYYLASLGLLGTLEAHKGKPSAEWGGELLGASLGMMGSGHMMKGVNSLVVDGVARMAARAAATRAGGIAVRYLTKTGMALARSGKLGRYVLRGVQGMGRSAVEASRMFDPAMSAKAAVDYGTDAYELTMANGGALVGKVHEGREAVDAALGGVLSAFAEQWGENLPSGVPSFGLSKLLDKGFGKFAKSALGERLSRTAAGRLLTRIGDNPLGGSLKEYMRFTNMLDEAASEVWGDALLVATGYEDHKRVFSLDNLEEVGKATLFLGSIMNLPRVVGGSVEWGYDTYQHLAVMRELERDGVGDEAKRLFELYREKGYGAAAVQAAVDAVRRDSRLSDDEKKRRVLALGGAGYLLGRHGVKASTASWLGVPAEEVEAVLSASWEDADGVDAAAMGAMDAASPTDVALGDAVGLGGVFGLSDGDAGFDVAQGLAYREGQGEDVEVLARELGEHYPQYEAAYRAARGLEDSETARQRMALEAVAHDDGNVYRGVLDGREVSIVRGGVVLDDAGRVDYAASDVTVMVRDEASGAVRQASLSDIEGVEGMPFADAWAALRGGAEAAAGAEMAVDGAGLEGVDERNSVRGNSTDTATTFEGNENATATLENAVSSDGKVNESLGNRQGVVSEDGVPPTLSSALSGTSADGSAAGVASPTLSDGIGRRLTADEAQSVLAQMIEQASVVRELSLTPEHWLSEFGESGEVETPFGVVKMGENQYLKLARKGRDGKLGMIKPTLAWPDLIIEDSSDAVSGDSSRPSSLVFVKTFVKEDGSRYYHFTSVTVSQSGREVVISNQERRANRISALLQNGVLVYKKAGISLHPFSQVEGSVPLNESSTPTSSDNQRAWHGVGSSDPASVDKVSESFGDGQVEGVESAVLPTASARWSELLASCGGDVEMALSIAEEMVEDSEGALRKLAKAKAKRGGSLEEKLAAHKGHREALAAAETAVAHWREVVVYGRSAMAVAAVEVAGAVAAGSVDADALTAIPDMVDDTAAAARERGFRRWQGEAYARQGALEGVEGKAVEVRFTDKMLVKGRVMVVEAGVVQPSHLDGGRNPMHFIDEAQPKDRKDAVSAVAAERMAKGLRAEEITGSVTAYSGAPVVNGRGEVIQGNNRARALRLLWSKYPEQAAAYKAYLVGHAEAFGIDGVAVEGMASPVLVSVLDVSDAAAIELGQYVASHTESGGVERIKAEHTIGLLGGDFGVFADMLLDSSEEEGTSELIGRNGVRVLGWLAKHKYITETQFKSAFDADGRLTAGVKEDLRNLLYARLFVGAPTQLASMFEVLPARVKQALLGVAYRADGVADGVLKELHASIGAYYTLWTSDKAFKEAKDFEAAYKAVLSAGSQLSFGDMGQVGVRLSNFSNFALLLAALYRGGSQAAVKRMLTEVLDRVHGVGGVDMFEGGRSGAVSLAEAIDGAVALFGSENSLLNGFRYDGKFGSDGLAVSDRGGESWGRGGVVSVESGGASEGGKGSAELVGGVGSVSETSEGDGAGGVAEGGDKQARLNRLRASAPVVLSGREYEGKYSLDRDSAKSWLKENLRGVYRIADTQEEVSLTKVGLNKVTSHSMGNEAHLKSLVAIPTLLERAIFIEEQASDKANAKYDAYRYYAVGLRLGGVDYTVKLTIGVKQGKKYYDHALTEVEKGKLLDLLENQATGQGFTTAGGAPLQPSALSKYKDTKLLSLLQVSDEGITPEQQSLLDGHNPHQYPAERALPEASERSEDKVSESFGDGQVGAVGNEVVGGTLAVDAPIELPASYGADNRLVSRARHDELVKRLRAKLGGQLNVGIDPELLSLGLELGLYHVEAGARKFADFARVLVGLLGDSVRPYLKAYYNGVRELPEVVEAGWVDELTPYDEVRGFDVVGMVFDGEVVPLQVEASEVLEAANSKELTHDGKEEVHLRAGGSDGFGTAGSEHRLDEPLGAEAGHEDEFSLSGGVDRRGEPHLVSDGMGGGGVSERSALSADVADAVVSAPRNTRNNRGARGVDYVPKTKQGRILANFDAIALLRALEERGDAATPEDMAVLRQFSGWGGLSELLSKSDYRHRLIELFGEDGFAGIAESALTSYYTPAYVSDVLWDIAAALGFEGGLVLESSAGIGNILGQMPEAIASKSVIRAIEKEEVSGGILGLLYPDAEVSVSGMEEVAIGNNSVGLAITNVPFATGFLVNDKCGDGDLSRLFGSNLHDYAIAKNVRKLRAGGIGIFITTSGTLDKSDKLRAWLVGAGGVDVVGAFRLNNETFDGTRVTSDIVVVRKRGADGAKSAHAIDVSHTEVVRSVEVEDKLVPLYYNSYFVQHPEYMAGEMALGAERGDTFRPKSSGLYANGVDQVSGLSAFVADLGAKDWDTVAFEEVTEAAPSYEHLGEGVREGSLVLDSKGEFVIARDGVGVPAGFNDKKVKGYTKQEVYVDYVAVKSALAAVLDYQRVAADDAGLQPLLDGLNVAFDHFVGKYGHFVGSNARNLAWLRNSDVDYSEVAALVKSRLVGTADGGTEEVFEKSDVMRERVVRVSGGEVFSDARGGVMASLRHFNHVDLSYIADVLGRAMGDVRAELLRDGVVYEEPVSGMLEPAHLYLSGDIREKLAAARAQNSDGRYSGNIAALEGVLPAELPTHLIDFNIGSNWLPSALFSEFIEAVTGVRSSVKLVGSSWAVSDPRGSRYVFGKNRESGVYSEAFGTWTSGLKIIEAAMNNKSIEVSRREKGKAKEVDKVATAAVQDKIEQVRADFKEWLHGKLRGDAALSEEVGRLYNDKFRSFVPVRMPQELVPARFVGASEQIVLRAHQGAAAMRALTQPLLLHHEVGTGKTFTMLTAAMEMRRIGLAKKPMLVVQNATLSQFGASAKVLYPTAKVLLLGEADKSAEGRRAFYANIRYNDWDMVIISQSAFNKIPDAPARVEAYLKSLIEERLATLSRASFGDSSKEADAAMNRLQREVEDLEARLAEVRADGVSAKALKAQAKRENNAKARAERMLERDTDDVLDFDELGIDALFVDEAHEYKHLGFSTSIAQGVKGVDPSYSKKCHGLFLKVQSVFERTGGRNVVFATGTPVSNTAAEVWTFLRYLNPEALAKRGVSHFDDFVRNFGDLRSTPEFATNGVYKIVSRLAGYSGMPELSRMYSEMADVVRTVDAGEVQEKIPEIETGKAQDIFLPQTRSLREVMLYVKKAYAAYERMEGKEKRANSHIPVVLYGVANAAAVDTRLVVANGSDDAGSKTNRAVAETLRSLKETEAYRGVVAIFADRYQNKASGFNLYEDIRAKLIARGVPAESVVVMKQGMSDVKKAQIFEKVNSGDVRVVLGSTQTLGTGVNIQERLHTLIHLDAPNRPMDYTQRNGRILRQGNLHRDWNKPVRILRFGVEDSLDVTAYQRLHTKGKMAEAIANMEYYLLDGDVERTLEDDVDNFGDMLAMLSGSEYALLKNQAEKDVRRLEARFAQWRADQAYIHVEKPKVRAGIADAERLGALAEGALAKLSELLPAGGYKGVSVGKLRFGSVDEMGDFLKAQNKKLHELSEYVKRGDGEAQVTSAVSVSFDGVVFDFTTSVRRVTASSGGVLKPKAERDLRYSCAALGLVDVPVKGGLLKDGLLDVVDNVLSGKDFIEMRDVQAGVVRRLSSLLADMEARDGKPFADAEALEASKARLVELEGLMQKEMAAKAAKYAKMDAGLSAAEGVSYDEEGAGDEGEVRHRRGGSDVVDGGRVASEALMAYGGVLNGALGGAAVLHADAASARAAGGGRAVAVGAKGWYDVRTGAVHVHVYNHAREEDLERTLLHEVVGHKGVRGLLGRGFDRFLDDVYRSLGGEAIGFVADASKDMSSQVSWRRELTEEYIAGMAEAASTYEASIWERVVAALRKALRRLGIVGWNDGDLRALLRAARQRTELLRVGGSAEGGISYRMGTKKSALDTASPEVASGSLTAMLSTDDAKLLKNIDAAILSYENTDAKVVKSFIGDVAAALGIDAKDKSSKYVTIEAKNGKVFTLRLSNHNAHVSNFDAHGEMEGVSLVVSNKPSEGVANDGEAHVTEYYYNAMKLQRADGKPLAEILRGIKQAFYSGEYVDRTGLAEVHEVNARSVDGFDVEGGIRYRWGWPRKEAEAAKLRAMSADAVRSAFDQRLNGFWHNATEIVVDQLQSVQELQKVVGMLHGRGKDGLPEWCDVYSASLLEGSRAAALIERANVRYWKPLVESGKALREAMGWHQEALEVYMMQRSGLERNGYMAIKAAMRVLSAKEGAEAAAELWEAYVSYRDGVYSSGMPVSEQMVAVHDWIKARTGLAVRDASGLSGVAGVEALGSEDVLNERDMGVLMAWYADGMTAGDMVARCEAELLALEDRLMAVRGALVERPADVVLLKEGDLVGRGVAKAKLALKKAKALAAKVAASDAHHGAVHAHAVSALRDVEGVMASSKVDYAEAFWRAVKAVNGANLKTQVDYGLLGEGDAEALDRSMPNYVPLRGHEDRIDSSKREFADVMRAEGRASKADSPLMYMKQGLAAAINQGVRNMTGLRLLHMAEQFATPLMTPVRLWVLRDGVDVGRYDGIGKVEDGMFVPELSGARTPADVKERVAAFERLVRELRGEGLVSRPAHEALARYYDMADERKAVVPMRRGGVPYAVYMNAGSRVAVALKGGLRLKVGDGMGSVGRAARNYYSRALTTWSPRFMLSNYSRDLMFATMNSDKPARQFAESVRALVVVGMLLHKWTHGTLAMESELQRNFYDFMKGGGETGFSHALTLEEHRAAVEELFKDAGWRDKVDAWEVVVHTNRCVELTNRFAAYQTARSGGKSVEASVLAAKEATTNFNRSGSGSNGQLVGNRFQQGMLRLVRLVMTLTEWQSFTNASIQGANAIRKAAARRPLQFALWSTLHALRGACEVLAYVHLRVKDDDDDEVARVGSLNLSDFVLGNTLDIGVGDVRLPLAHGYRAFSVLGYELAAALYGLKDWEDAVGTIAETFAREAGVPAGGRDPGELVTFLGPVFDLWKNKDFLGRKIVDDSLEAKALPYYKREGWTKQPEVVSDVGRWFYEQWGKDWDVASAYHVVKGLLGGLGGELERVIKLVDDWDGNKDEKRNWPVIGSVLSDLNAEGQNGRMTRMVYDFEAQVDESRRAINATLVDARAGLLEGLPQDSLAVAMATEGYDWAKTDSVVNARVAAMGVHALLFGKPQGRLGIVRLTDDYKRAYKDLGKAAEAALAGAELAAAKGKVEEAASLRAEADKWFADQRGVGYALLALKAASKGANGGDVEAAETEAALWSEFMGVLAEGVGTEDGRMARTYLNRMRLGANNKGVLDAWDKAYKAVRAKGAGAAGG